MSEPTTTTVRIPFDLHSWLAAQAEKERRSFNSQLLYVIDQAKRAEEQASQNTQ